jgi:hypothetical protein
VNPVLVLDDDAARWPDPSVVPDWSTGDWYEPSDLVIEALRVLRDTAWTERPIVVAVGPHHTAGELLALGGRAAALVLVGDDAPAIADPRAAQACEYAWLRARADGAGGVNPRRDAEHTARQRAAIPVPVLELPDAAPHDVLAEVSRWWVRR